MPPHNPAVDWRAVALFFTLAMAGALALAAAWWAVGPGVGQLLVGIAYMWTPGLAAIWMARRARRPVRELTGLRLGAPLWLLASLLAPVGFYALLLGWGAALPGVDWAPDSGAVLARIAPLLPPDGLAAAQAQLEALPVPLFWVALAGVAPGALLNAPAALGEELGWRGWLHEALLPLGPLRASLLTGALWGLWHAPLILQGYNFPDAPVAGAAVMVAGCMALSPVMTALRLRSGSVLSAVLFHGAINAGGQVPLSALEGPGLVVHPLGLVGILAALTMAAPAVWSWRRGAGSR